MKYIANRILEKIKDRQEFSVSDKDIGKVIKKKRNWRAPGIDQKFLV